MLTHRFLSDGLLALRRHWPGLGVALLFLAQVALAQSPLLFPTGSPDSPAQTGSGSRLPMWLPAPASPALASSLPWSADQLEFAAGALSAPRPQRWWVEDFPRGSYVFLLLAPKKPPRHLGALPLGIWATFVPRGPGHGRQEMTQEQLAHVVRTLAGGRFVLPQARPTRWHGHWGLLIQSQRSSQSSPLAMAALGVTTPWGEYYAGYVAAGEQASWMHALWRQWLRRSKLRAPQRPEVPEPAEQMAPAAALLGWWKAPRGQLYLGPQGQVVLQFDRRGSFEPGPDGTLRYDRPLVQLRGTAVAREDLLLVTWSDGSQTNYRWRLHQGDLLLTDHLGRTSRLKPLARWHQ